MAELSEPSRAARHALRLAALSCFFAAPLGIAWFLWLLLGLVQLEATRDVVLLFFVPGSAGVALAVWRLWLGSGMWRLASGAAERTGTRPRRAALALGVISLCTGGSGSAYAAWFAIAGDSSHHSMIWLGPMVLLLLVTGWLVCAHGVLLLRAGRRLRDGRLRFGT